MKPSGAVAATLKGFATVKREGTTVQRAIAPRSVWAGICLTVGLVLHLGAGLADAQESTADDQAKLFDRLDANGDGQVAADEVPAEQQRLVRRLFRTGDEDGDGSLSREEFAAALARRPGRDPAAGDAAPGERPPRDGQPAAERPRNRRPGQPDGRDDARGRSPLVAALDANRDGAIDADEIAGASAALRQLDRDGDGRLSPRELGAQGPLARGGRPGGEPGGPRPERPSGDGGNSERPNAAAFLNRLKEADRDGDGRLSRDEAPARMAKAFDRLDADGDNSLDAEELKAAAERLMARGRRDGGNPDGADLPGNPRRRPQGRDAE